VFQAWGGSLSTAERVPSGAFKVMSCDCWRYKPDRPSLHKKFQKYISSDEQAGAMHGVKFFFSGDAIPDGSKPNSATCVMDKHTSSRRWQMDLTLC
jgi:hypothetical protein